MRSFNITKTYADKYDPWSEVLDAAAFAILSTANRLKYYSTGQLLFGSDINILIKNMVDWELIRQRN